MRSRMERYRLQEQHDLGLPDIALPNRKTVFYKGTKTDSSVRSIKLPEQAFELLKEHRK